ncbi:hypothetical protein EZS27_029535, partial [termite gut metagenome]
VQRGGEGNNVVVISVSKNEGTTERSATVSAKAGNLSIAIKVTQVGSALVLHLLNENDRTINFPTEGGNRSVGIVTNLSKEEWEYTVNNNVGNWLSVTKSEAGDALEITASANEGEERSATVTLSSSKLTTGTGNELRTITVTQNVIPNVTVTGGENNSFALDWALHEITFKVTTNMNLTLTAPNWITLSQSVIDKGANELTITATVAANDRITGGNLQTRTGEITIKLADVSAGDNTWALTVEQTSESVWKRLTLTGGTWNSSTKEAEGSDFYTSNPNNDYNLLIDNATSNHWQTEWNGTLKQPTLNWLQIDLKKELTTFRFEFFGKKNKDICPVTFKIYGWKGSGEPYKPAKYVSPDLLDPTDERIAWVNETDNWFVIGEETHTEDYIAFSTLACTTGFAKVYSAESAVRYIRFAATESTGTNATLLEVARPPIGLIELIISEISPSSGE